MTTTALRFTGDHPTWMVLLGALAVTSLGALVSCKSTSSTPPGGDIRPKERAESRKHTTLNLTDTQLAEFDATRAFSPTPEQSALLIRESGAAPSFFHMYYSEPDGADALLGFNVAVRTGPMTVSIPHHYIFTDPELLYKRRLNQWFLDPKVYSPPKKDYPSYLIDHKGGVWKFQSKEECQADLARGRGEIGAISVLTPTTQLNMHTFASEDTLRHFRQWCFQSDLNKPHVVTASPEVPLNLPPHKPKSR